MTKLEEMSIDSLKLKHEEYKLFLQIIWSGLLALVMALLAGTYTEKIGISFSNSIFMALIIILGGIIITLISFTRKFDEIREQVDKKRQ